MVRSKFMKGLILGLCMSAMVTGTAFAKEAVTTLPAVSAQELSDEMKAFYEKQKEIEKYVFQDHVKELEEKGITVHYIGISDKGLEIGVSPYNDETKKFFYDTFGKEDILLMEFDESILYATTAQAPDAADADAGVMAEDPAAESADDKAVIEDVAEESPDNKAVTEDAAEDEMNIQIESVDETAEATDQEAYDTMAADGKEARTVAAETGAVEDTSKKDGVSAPLMILIIAGGAALIGSGIIIAKKR